MSEVVVTYFPGKGRAEAIKLALHLANLPFKFNPITDWPTVKAEGIQNGSLPFGQVPLVHIDGLDLVQSLAILRYISNSYVIFFSFFLLGIFLGMLLLRLVS